MHASGWLFALAPLFAAAQQSPLNEQVKVRGRLLVSGYTSGAVHAYRARDGRLMRKLEPVPGAQSIELGADGLLYICAESAGRVLRFDAHTLGYVDAFVWDDPLTPQDETGGLDGPTAAVGEVTPVVRVNSQRTGRGCRHSARRSRW